jgi:purine catabolism regulator
MVRAHISTICKVADVYPTLAEILELPVVKAGLPRVRAGRSALDTRVRWVHVSEQRDPAGTLTGGELVLSIGVPAGDPTTDFTAYLKALREAGAVGLVIELGQHVRFLPEDLIQAARAMSFPLVELRRTIRFIELTEVVHSRVLNDQYARMQFAQRVSGTFRSLTVEGSDIGQVVAEAARLLELPIVLEDLGHRALSYAGEVAHELLRDWAARSRQTPGGPAIVSTGPEGWVTTPVGPRAARWGRLVLPRRRTDTDEVGMVLEQAADAITLLTLMNEDSPGVQLEAQSSLLSDLLESSPIAEKTLCARARALGLATGAAYEVLVLAAGSADIDRERGLLDTAAAAARGTGLPTLVGTLRQGRVGIIVSCTAHEAEADVVHDVVRGLPSGLVRVVGAADPAPSFGDLPHALAEAMHVTDVAAASVDPASRPVWRSRDLGVQGLVWRLRDDPRLLAYVDEQLGPILRLDDPRRSDLLRNLRAYAEADGMVTAFASRIGRSRPAAYARARKLSEVLGCDLDVPGTRLTLYLALLALDLPAVAP